MSVKLVVGLGNPGKKYMNSRHNAGFLAADYYAQKNELVFAPSSFHGELVKFERYKNTVLLVKPTTFMNDSGRCVQAVVNFYRIRLEDVLILYDDMDIELGAIRIRADGSSGGQNGMKSIIGALGTEELSRIRIGIGRPARTAGGFVIDHVLEEFNAADRKTMDLTLAKVAAAIEDFIALPLNQVMNKHNGKVGPIQDR